MPDDAPVMTATVFPDIFMQFSSDRCLPFCQDKYSEKLKGEQYGRAVQVLVGLSKLPSGEHLLHFHFWKGY
jgi:hypothetical protein